MKIDHQNVSGAGGSASISPADLAAAGSRRSGSSGNSTDQVDISGVSRAIQSFQSSRLDRINQLTSAVQSGSYGVNPSLVAGSIVNETLGVSAAQ